MNRRQLALYGAAATTGKLLVGGSVLLSAGPARSARPLKVGLLVQLSGPGVVFGPSGRYCAEIGVSEINARGGIAGRPLELVVGDAGQEPDSVVKTAQKMLTEDGVEAFVGLHDSAVRVALVRAFGGRVTYVYTATYEGGECSRGTYILGETPSQQLRPVIPWLGSQLQLKRWYLIGNDYNWPRGTNASARSYITSYGGQVVGEEYVPFSLENFEASVRRIRDAGADAVLITLVGLSSVQFNRAFSRGGLSQSVMRLGTLIEENTLAAIGATNSTNLYSSSGYFASIRTTAAKDFAALYTERFGGEAPPLNVLGQSCYEGLRLLEVMGNKAGNLEVERLEAIAQWQITEGPRGVTVMHGRHAIRDIYLAKADGANFKVIKTFEAVRSGEDCKV